MKALFIGGTGTISMAITRRLAEDSRWEIILFNHGKRNNDVPSNVKVILGDINDEEDAKNKLSGMSFDVVCDFVGFKKEQMERDYRLFNGKTKQFIYISSASAYLKPVRNYRITEETPLVNPYWEYSRNKALCEKYLMEMYKKSGFPVTIVRPSHTYDERRVPVAIHGNHGTWSVIERMRKGKKVLIPGDGTSLWVLTWNEDFAKGFTGLMNNPCAIGEAFHITTDEVLTWNEVYETLADILGVKLNACHVPSDFLADAGAYFYDYTGALLGDKANSVVFDNSKLKSAVPDFKCTTGFHDGARRAIEYCLSHPDRQMEDPEFDAFCDRVADALDEAKKKLMA